jgi:hypothetical protein
MQNLKEMIKDNKHVNFSFYRDKELWYSTEDGFEFPVPIEEVGNATFMAEDKAILFMRYIRKHLEMLDAAKKEHESQILDFNAHKEAAEEKKYREMTDKMVEHLRV